jgi:glycosyltransferase involved in cell wall biosynthesis
MNKPLVSVIAICYNHASYVEESLASVLAQTYQPIQLIVVDDASSDESVKVIYQFMDKQKDKNIKFISLSENQGNCKAFNIGLAQAEGKYVIDLATDDLLLPHCIESQINHFENLGEDYGVVFSDMYLINEKSDIIRQFYPRDKAGKLLKKVPSGEIYKEILARSFIGAASMMIRKKVLEEIGGYDESLSYEDYDLWVRTAKNYKYFFIDDTLVKKRILPNSHGKAFYLKKNNNHLLSTLKIHKKALAQNQTQEENFALSVSVRYHLRLSFFTENLDLVSKFGNILQEMKLLNWKDRCFIWLSRCKMPVYQLYKLVLRWRES